MANCATCKFFIPNPAPANDRVAGDCRVNPPTTVYDQQFGQVGVWPRVPESAWCGAFVAAPAAGQQEG